MNIKMQSEHEWQENLVGEWVYEHECSMEPGKPPEKFKGSESIRSLGGLWVLAEGSGEMPGGGVANTVMTLGYDPKKKRYVGTWVGSMMTHLWVYDGYLDAEGKVLTLETEGPDCTEEGKLVRYKDVIEIKGSDHRVMTSHKLGADGKWHPFMTASYRRKR
ncbi:DUF1579 domain-containing protein [Methylococcus geothermalis]|uniref:DUF1579 domain-containing protein n=2 Tax=Methylococcus geothermalis TaxID=2681310 RepID=A0A858Q906_9GAMM|nr:DUF1579 domain-containing protein [Methylococcus geothermalis]